MGTTFNSFATSHKCNRFCDYFEIPANFDDLEVYLQDGKDELDDKDTGASDQLSNMQLSYENN